MHTKKNSKWNSRTAPFSLVILLEWTTEMVSLPGIKFAPHRARMYAHILRLSLNILSIKQKQPTLIKIQTKTFIASYRLKLKACF